MGRLLAYYIALVVLVQLGFLSALFLLPDIRAGHLKRLWSLSVVELTMGACSMTIWVRLVRPLRRHARASALRLIIEPLTAAVILFLVATHASVATYYFFVGEAGETHAFAVFAFICAGLFLNLSAFAVGFSILGFILTAPIIRAIVAPFRNVPVLRNLLFDVRTQNIVAVVLALALTAQGLWTTSAPPIVSRVEIEIARLPPAFDGFTIVHLTDVHIGPTVGRARVLQAVDIVNKLEPDVITIAGDLVDGDVDRLRMAAAPLKALRSKHGTFYSTGNHEYYHGDINAWFTELRKLDITVLHNAHAKIRRHDESASYVCLAGTDDISAEASGVPGHAMNVSAALAGCDERSTRVVLIHQPRGARRALEEAVAVPSSHIDLILAGHTHGGQFYVIMPFAYATNYPYFLGLYTHGATGARVYVSGGVYFWGPPMKGRGLSEITFITLRAGQRST